MPYLIRNDYKRTIQFTELDAITQDDDSVRLMAEQSVEKEMRAYLIQKYDLSQEFQDTNIYDNTFSYKGTNRVYLDATIYDATQLFALNVLTLVGSQVYLCTTPITVPEAFTPAHWTLLGNQYDLFFVTLPFPLFMQDVFYAKGTQLFWKDKIYTSTRDSVLLTEQDQAQSIQIQDIISGNPIPGSGTPDAISMWGTGTAFSVAAGTHPTDTTKWTKGDNRNQYFVKAYMNMVIYDLCATISPNNVPEHRHNNWISATKMLKSFATGDLTAELPIIQPKQGNNIRYGGNVRLNNSW